MKRVIGTAAALAAALVLSVGTFVSAGDADTDTSAAVSETAAERVDTGGEISAEKRLGGVLLVSSVCGATVIAALIWRGRDRTKYL